MCMNQPMLIIGIDGLGGAGKSYFSEKLKKILSQQNYSVEIIHIDDFIYNRNIRYNPNYPEWYCYYFLQWRYEYLKSELIYQLKRDNEFHGSVKLYDKEKDKYFLQRLDISKNSVVIIEGVFLQREELKNIFDFIIYINVNKEKRIERILNRDIYIGNHDDILRKYNVRYFPAEEKYCLENEPIKNANFILNEEDFY